MSKMIEIRLSDAQCEALGAEAEAKGLKFFDHCRAKLLTNVTTPADRPYGRSLAMQALPELKRGNARVSAEVKEVDRIDRLELMMMKVAETLAQLAQPVAYAPDHAQEQHEFDGDIDDIVQSSLGEAERQGLTVVDREVAPAASGGVRHVGTRPPAPFSPSTQPRHLQGLGG